MLRTNPGFWFLCAVLQGNSPPAFSLVFSSSISICLSLSLSLHFLSFSLSLYLSVCLSTYYILHNVYIYFIHYTIIYLYRCTCIIYSQTWSSNLPSFYLLFYHSHCSVSFCLLFLHSPVFLLHTLPSRKRVATFFRSPSNPFSASACVHSQTTRAHTWSTAWSILRRRRNGFVKYSDFITI